MTLASFRGGGATETLSPLLSEGAERRLARTVLEKAHAADAMLGSPKAAPAACSPLLTDVDGFGRSSPAASGPKATMPRASC